MIKITKQQSQAPQIIVSLTPAELFSRKTAWVEAKTKHMIWGDSGFFLK